MSYVTPPKARLAHIWRTSDKPSEPVLRQDDSVKQPKKDASDLLRKAREEQIALKPPTWVQKRNSNGKGMTWVKLPDSPTPLGSRQWRDAVKAGEADKVLKSIPSAEVVQKAGVVSKRTKPSTEGRKPKPDNSPKKPSLVQKYEMYLKWCQKNNKVPMPLNAFKAQVGTK